MTLRYRLLLVYLIVVLLSCVTVGIAVREIYHSRKVVDDLRRWQNIALQFERLRTAFERDVILTLTGATPQQAAALQPPGTDFPTLLSHARSFLGFDEVRWEYNKLLEEYSEWQNANGGRSSPVTYKDVRHRLDSISTTISNRLNKLLASAQAQDQRTVNLLLLVLVITLVHITIVGLILRIWLLRPTMQLTRQVEALGRDEPPAEPLLTSPAELAALARALEEARISLDAARRKLIESERMTTVGQMAAQLAHNLRNPLASIRAAAQVAAKRGAVDEYARQRLDEIMAAADRLDLWVSGLLEFVRPTTARLERGNVVPLVELVRDAVRAELAAKDCRLEIEAPPEGLMVYHEPASLEQALMAAVINAIEASDVGATITARVTSGCDAKEQACGEISIIDRGPGLPCDDPERAFELNFSTKASGLGIGLSLARQVIQRQGGTVTAERNPDGGTIIRFRLKASTGEHDGQGPGC